MNIRIGRIATALLFLPLLASAAPLSIDLTTPVAPAKDAPYGPGTEKSSQGHEIRADSRSFYLDGKPWIPIAGEFHYSRYPQSEWRDELLKMKAGGITVVSTYVFWIFHEETEGKFDWSGQRSLRDFLLLCQQLGLKVVVRMGPWCHGEVRNGGVPDWAEHSGAKLRTTDPAFMAMVKPLYLEEAKQMQGLLWKNGGPVIGVQVDNECNNVPYLLALKKLAQDVGIDVPIYEITGWQIKLPNHDLLPLFGGYADGFWGGSIDNYRKEFFFTDTRATNDLGAQMTTKSQANNDAASLFPYACAEIGPGMMSSYKKRILLPPDVYGAMALTKLGDGNNMPGYYMYQGGMNPESEATPQTTLQETHPNFMPLRDYDFETALGACGEVREQFHLLLEQHLFLNDFGATFARMPAYFPNVRPSSSTDFDTLRWDVRSDGTSGYLFFSNEQPYLPLPDHKDVQFQVKTAAGTQLIPREPITIPTGAYGCLPFNIDCDGVTLEYATAQLLSRVVTGDHSVTYFLAALPGLDPELVLKTNGGHANSISAEKDLTGSDFRAYKIKPGVKPVLSVAKANGASVQFIVLTQEQARHLWRTDFAGQDRVILSKATVLSADGKLRLLADDANDLAISIFPPLTAVTLDGVKLSGAKDGTFARFLAPHPKQPDAQSAEITLDHAAGPNATAVSGTDEASWADAATYKVTIPKATDIAHSILHIHYIGNAIRVYVGDKLYDDNYFNGDTLNIALRRIPGDQLANLNIKLLPYTDEVGAKLPDAAKAAAASAKASGTLDRVTGAISTEVEAQVTASAN